MIFATLCSCLEAKEHGLSSAADGAPPGGQVKDRTAECVPTHTIVIFSRP
jgi:hypothetical protein